MPALIIGANLPDVDAACMFWLEGAEPLGFRRGITHGPPAMVLLPLLLAAILWGYDRWQSKRGKRPEARLPVNFKWLFLLSFIGCLTHPALDWLNVYGIRFLEPFSSQWFYGDTLFIIDLWLWALMGFAFVFSLRRERRGSDWVKPARMAIIGSLAYIGMNWAISYYDKAQTRTIAAPDAEVISSPPPFFFWHREKVFGYDHGSWQLGLSTFPGADAQSLERLPAAEQQCQWPQLEQLRQSNSQLDAYLFWTRAPYAERAPDGSVILRDARFTDLRAIDQFSLALPDVPCEELRGE